MEKNDWPSQLLEKILPKKRENGPLLSIVVATFNSSENINYTLESIKNQTYRPIEIIIVDAGSQDTTLDIAGSYAPLVKTIYLIPEYNRYEMYNMGKELSKGEYLTFLQPGCIYLSDIAIESVMEKAIDEKADMIYFGGIQREKERIYRTFFTPLLEENLRMGKITAPFHGSFFHKKVFERIPLFDTHLNRSYFDFLAKVVKDKTLKKVFFPRIYIEFDYGHFTFGKFFLYLKETGHILAKHFGIAATMSWFFGLNHLRIVKLGWSLFKKRFLKI